MTNKSAEAVARDVWAAYQEARYGKRTDLIQCIAIAIERERASRLPSREEMFEACAKHRGDCAEWGPCYNWLAESMKGRDETTVKP